MGNPAGNEMPEGVNVLPFQISLAAQVPHAVGLAWGLRHRGGDGVVLVYFGDGASSEGDVHEAMNLAGVRRAPVVFLLQNNGYAISTPVAQQTARDVLRRSCRRATASRASSSTATTCWRSTTRRDAPSSAPGAATGRR